MGYCCDSGTLSFCATYMGGDGLFGGLLDTFEGLPSYDEQVAFVINFANSNWNDAHRVKSLNAIKSQIGNMSGGEVRDLYKYYHDYYSGGSRNNIDMPDDLQNSVTTIFSNYNIPFAG